MSFLQGLVGPPDISKLETKRDVPGLIRALGYERDARVRGAAAETLGDMGDARAVEPLLSVLQDKDGNVRRSAATALGKLGDTRAVDALVATLRVYPPEARKAAAEALGKLGDARAVEPLVVALKDKDRRVQLAAAEALTRLGVPDHPSTRAWCAALMRKWDEAAAMGNVAVEPLVDALKLGWYDDRRLAAEALGKIGDARAAEPLMGALKDNEKGVRQAAAEALGKIGDARAVEPLVAALKDSDWDIRWSAIMALGRLGEARAVEPLAAALKPNNRTDVRLAGAEALGRLGDARAIEPLVAALKDADKDVRQAAAEALVKFGQPAVESLVAAMKDKDRHASEAATEALVRIGQPAVEPLVAVLKHSKRDGCWAAAEALGKIGDARAVEPLVDMLKDADGGLRRQAARVLTSFGVPDDPCTRAWLAVAMGQWDKAVDMGEVAVEPLVAEVHNGWGEQDEAARALGKIGDARAVGPLVAALEKPHREVRQAAAEALKNLHHSGRLDAQAQELILRQRLTMAERHRDQYVESYCGRPSEHTDEGIGVVL